MGDFGPLLQDKAQPRGYVGTYFAELPSCIGY